MSWGRVDDKLVEHPKWVRLEREFGGRTWADALAIWTWVLCYTSRNETDGGIDATVLARASPIGRAAIKAADAMVAVGLMDREGPLYILHDFTDYNPSRAQLVAKRAADSERKKGKHTASESERIPVGIQAEPQRIPEPPAGARAPDPVPTRPLPSPESERERALEAPVPLPEADPVASALRAGYGRRYQAHAGDAWLTSAQADQHVKRAAAWCRAQPAPLEAAERFLDGAFAHEPWKRSRWPWKWLAEDPALTASRSSLAVGTMGEHGTLGEAMAARMDAIPRMDLTSAENEGW